MGFFKVIKNIINNTPPEEMTKTASPNKGASAKHTATRSAVSNNTPNNRATTTSPSSTNPAKHNVGSGEPVSQSKTDGDASFDTKYPGVQAVWKGNNAWDKHREAEAVKFYEQALAEGYWNGAGDNIFYRLGKYYKEKKRWEDLRHLLKMSPEYVQDQRWYVESIQLVEANLGKMPNGWIDIEGGKTANGETWSEQYERLTSAFPQFDFDEGDSESEIREEDMKALRDFELDLEYRRQQAQACIEKKDYRQAAEICAGFIRNSYWKPWPYDMLMDIYDKAGLPDERRRLAVHAEKFFNNRREDMRRYTLRLAAQVDCETYADNLIKEGKRIPYHDGLFDVYSPYPEIEEWRKIIGG